MGKRITEEQKSEIRKYVREGKFNQKDIAEIVGCSVPAVSRYGKEEVEEEEVEEEEQGLTVDDYNKLIMDCKDAHIKSLENAISQIATALSQRP